jgi:hypothetical protein
MASNGQPRDLFGANWPYTARKIGVFILLAEMLSGFLGGPVSAEVLAGAGALLVAPGIAGAQERRNERRGP